MTVSDGGQNKGRCSSSGCEDDGRERIEMTPKRKRIQRSAVLRGWRDAW